MWSPLWGPSRGAIGYFSRVYTNNCGCQGCLNELKGVENNWKKNKSDKLKGLILINLIFADTKYPNLVWYMRTKLIWQTFMAFWTKTVRVAIITYGCWCKYLVNFWLISFYFNWERIMKSWFEDHNVVINLNLFGLSKITRYLRK